MFNLSMFSERLKELMYYHGEIKSEELAKQIGVSGVAVRGWLNGENEPKLSTAVQLSDLFACSLDFLAGRTAKDEEIKQRPLLPFYARLREVMQKENISRYAVTRDTAVKDSFFTRWKKGESPRLSTACELADYMKISLDYLTGRTDF